MLLLTFKLDNWCCALPISKVDKAYRAVAITSLPETPEIVLGIIDVRGSVIPVINIRRRFHLQGKQLTVSDQFIVARAYRRQIALVVDSLDGVIECPEEEIIPADAILPGLEHVQGVVKTKSGMILVHDLDRFLSLEEVKQLDHAMASISHDDAASYDS